MTYRFMIKRLLQAGSCCSLALALGSCGGGSDSDTRDTGLAPLYFMPQECASAKVSLTVSDMQGAGPFDVVVVCQGGGNDPYNGLITSGSITENKNTVASDGGNWSQLQPTGHNQFNGLRFRCEDANFLVEDMCLAIQARDDRPDGVPAKLQGQAIRGDLFVRESSSSNQRKYPLVGCTVTIEYVSAGTDTQPEGK